MKLTEPFPIISICHPNYSGLVLRSLQKDDGQALADYFAQMSQQTRSFFAPHPLNDDAAQLICQTLDAQSHLSRFVLCDRSKRILGYFILQWEIDPRETLRYSGYHINLEDHPCVSFAPSMSEELINKGIGTVIFEGLKQHALAARMQIMILMGGVQARNHLGVHFYRKLGFKTVGGFNTQVENIDMILPLVAQSV